VRLTFPSSRPCGARLGAPALAALGAIAGLLMRASPAAAATGGGTMPWDTVLTTVETDLTGPVATAIGVICCIIFGLSMAFGHEGSAMKRGMSILFGLAIAFTSSTGLLTVFGGGTGAVF
jgi:type IV secretory pathway VirB2 component (pilin)